MKTCKQIENNIGVLFKQIFTMLKNGLKIPYKIPQ